jgi:hypothetical protein
MPSTPRHQRYQRFVLLRRLSSHSTSVHIILVIHCQLRSCERADVDFRLLRRGPHYRSFRVAKLEQMSSYVLPNQPRSSTTKRGLPVFVGAITAVVAVVLPAQPEKRIICASCKADSATSINIYAMPSVARKVRNQYPRSRRLLTFLVSWCMQRTDIFT